MVVSNIIQQARAPEMPMSSSSIPITAVTFDGDGTLWDVLAAARQALSAVAATISRERLAGARTVSVRQLEAARAEAEREHPDWSMELLRRQSFLTILARHGALDLDTSQLWKGFLDARRDQTSPFDDAAPVLRFLRSRAVKTGLLSNGNTLPEQVGLGGCFDHVQVAEYAGVRKPDPAAFTVAAAALRCEPATVLHVGDDEREDYAAARAAGFQAVLLRRDGAVATDSIETLARIPELLGLAPS